MSASGHGPESPNGTVTTITHGRYAATVTEVGGGLHSLTFDGRDLVVSWPLDTVCPNHRGSVLAPWPNRIADGHYSFEGAQQQLPINEVDRHNAIHGLVSWLPFGVVDSGPDHVTVGARIWPQTGYPFLVDVAVHYRLDDDGLRWEITATNHGGSPAPYGASVHPYLVAGPGHVDDWTLLVPAGEVLEVDPDRLLPRGVAPVPAELDFRTARAIGETRIDHAYTGLTGRRVEVRTADGSGVALEIGDPEPWVQIHTADRPEPDRDRIGMAVEPMSCPPDAYNSGTDLVVLEPGASHTLALRIAALEG
ncbi:aldose 1-epimerase family protein [Jatrophihabitans sp. YIM 134969]